MFETKIPRRRMRTGRKIRRWQLPFFGTARGIPMAGSRAFDIPAFVRLTWNVIRITDRHNRFDESRELNQVFQTPAFLDCRDAHES